MRRSLLSFAVASIMMGAASGGCAVGDDGMPFDAGPLLDPCVGGPNDGDALPLERDNISWVDAAPLVRGRNVFEFALSSELVDDVASVELLAELPDRDHDAFVPALTSVTPSASGTFSLPIDLFLEGAWAIDVTTYRDDGTIGEEVRFAFCVAP